MVTWGSTILRTPLYILRSVNDGYHLFFFNDVAMEAMARLWMIYDDLPTRNGDFP